MPQASYHDLLERSQSVNWRIDDLVGGERRFDFARPFLPETFARTAELDFLSDDERRLLNQIRSRGYLAMFELVEQFVVPFVSDLASENAADDDPYRAPALRQFVREENKHRELFRRALADFDAGFRVECALIGPAETVVAAILAHGPLAVTIATLGLEWMSQGHFLESVTDDASLDPQFKRLLEHHWLEEAQHAALDGLMLRDMATAADAAAIDRAIDEYLHIARLFDGAFKAQAELDLVSFERAAGRSLAPDDRQRFVERQHQALRWTFLGSAMRNANFLAELEGLSPAAHARVAEASAAFC